MCHRSDSCEHYKHCKGNPLSEACENCAYVRQIKRIARLSQIGLVIVILAFITTTYIVY